jgi:hypothetical protein
LFIKNTNKEPGIVTYICNSSTKEVKAGGLRIQDQPGLHSKTLCQQNKTTAKKEGDKFL